MTLNHDIIVYFQTRSAHSTKDTINKLLFNLTFNDLKSLKNDIFEALDSLTHNLLLFWLEFCEYALDNKQKIEISTVCAKLSFLVAECILLRNIKGQTLFDTNLAASKFTPKQNIRDNANIKLFNEILNNFLYLRNRHDENNLKLIETKILQPNLKNILTSHKLTELENILSFLKNKQLAETQNANITHLQKKKIYNDFKSPKPILRLGTNNQKDKISNDSAIPQPPNIISLFSPAPIAVAIDEEINLSNANKDDNEDDNILKIQSSNLLPEVSIANDEFSPLEKELPDLFLLTEEILDDIIKFTKYSYDSRYEVKDLKDSSKDTYVVRDHNGQTVSIKKSQDLIKFQNNPNPQELQEIKSKSKKLQDLYFYLSGKAKKPAESDKTSNDDKNNDKYALKQTKLNFKSDSEDDSDYEYLDSLALAVDNNMLLNVDDLNFKLRKEIYEDVKTKAHISFKNIPSEVLEINGLNDTSKDTYVVKDMKGNVTPIKKSHNLMNFESRNKIYRKRLPKPNTNTLSKTPEKIIKMSEKKDYSNPIEYFSQDSSEPRSLVTTTPIKINFNNNKTEEETPTLLYNIDTPKDFVHLTDSPDYRRNADKKKEILRRMKRERIKTNYNVNKIDMKK